MLAPCAITTEPGAVPQFAVGHSPAAKKPDPGRRASTANVAGTALSQVGGSTIALSRAGIAPVMTLFAPPVLSQNTMPLRPLPAALLAVRPATWPPAVRKFAPLSWPPM